MREEHDLTPAQRELEMALKSVMPAGARVDPVAAAFAAGRRSAGRNVRLWRSATALLVLALAGSWLLPARRDGFDRATYRPGQTVVSAQPSPAGPFSDQSLLILEATVREKGVDGMPVTHLPAVREMHSMDTL